MDEQSLPVAGLRRVWLRAFWGFDPQEEGYVGFTREGNRQRFLDEFNTGDLILIYGADASVTQKEHRRQLLGFLEVEPIPIRDVDKSSAKDQAWKAANGFSSRWTFAVPVRRAWRINRRIEAHNLARDTFLTHNAVLIASRGELLSEKEAEAALRLPVTECSVFGEPPLPERPGFPERALGEILSPSRGVPPSFGERHFEVGDAENRLYVLKLAGDVASFLGRQRFEVTGKAVVKVGHAKEPDARCASHNAHLPVACAFRWQVEFTSRPFPGGREAKEAEDKLKQAFHAKCESLGGEFFLVDQRVLSCLFADVTRSTGFQISM